MAVSAQAELIWTGTSGDYELASNWDLNRSPTSLDDVRISNGGTAVVSEGSHAANRIYLANDAGSCGSILLTGGLLTSGNIQVGSKGTALLDVGSSAAVHSSGTVYTGVFGMEQNSNYTNTAGVVNLAGTMTASTVVIASNSGDGSFNLNGGNLAVSGNFDMNNTANYTNSFSTLTVNGSTGSFSVNNLYSDDAAVTLNFIADAGGVVPLEVAGTIHIGGATLNVDLSAYAGELSNFVLMDGTSLNGTFAAVNISGAGDIGVVPVYDTENGDVVLTSDSADRSGLVFSIIGVPGVDSHLQMPGVFSDHMILQRDTAVPVWGTAEPGTEVAVAFAGQMSVAVADAAGEWIVHLDALEASAVSRDLVVTAPGSRIQFSDVLIGEVWLCSGQSNMYRPIGGIPDLANSAVDGFEDVLALPENPMLRLFCDEGHPLWNDGRWQRARSETLNVFSGVGYFFGQKILEELDVPVGLMLVSRVGTLIQSWTPEEYALQAPVTEEYRALYEENRDEIIAYNRAPVPKPELSDELMVARTFGNVGGLYNNWMAAQVPFAIRGVIWYQGESNATWEPTARYYNDMLLALSTGLRGVWGRPEMPFYFVQLPNWDGATSGYWPWIRQSMLNACFGINHSGMVVTVDVGEADNLHPPKKKPVGERLALWALSNTYGRPCVYSGPLPSAAVDDTGGVRVEFDTFGSALEVPGGIWTDIEVAGDESVFYPATAVIDGSGARITCSQVANPVAVRYGWKPHFIPTLFNTDGLPASPFCYVRDAGSWRLCTGDDRF